MDPQLAFKDNYELGAGYSFTRNVFSPHHVSGPELGPGETAAPQADAICPLRNGFFGGETQGERWWSQHSVVMGRVMVGNPAHDPRRDMSPDRGRKGRVDVTAVTGRDGTLADGAQRSLSHPGPYHARREELPGAQMVLKAF